MSQDIRVILIKISDRLHNMRTMRVPGPSRSSSRQVPARPWRSMPPSPTGWACRTIKWELEDRSLKYLDPVGYEEIIEMLDAKRQEYDEFMCRSPDQYHRAAAEGERHRAATVYGRVKHHLLHLPQDVSPRTSPWTRSTTSIAFRVIRGHAGRLLQRPGPHPRPVQARCPAASRTISPPPSPTATRACTPPSSATRASPLRCRSAPARCTSMAEYGVAAHWKYKQNGQWRRQSEEQL